MTWWRIDPAKGYRWYTIGSGLRPCVWVKLGPISLWSYRWDGQRAYGLQAFVWVYDSPFGWLQ